MIPALVCAQNAHITEVDAMSLKATEQPVMFTFPTAAELMGIGTTQLYELVRAKRLRVVGIGKRGRRVPRSEIERFIADALAESEGQ